MRTPRFIEMMQKESHAQPIAPSQLLRLANEPAAVVPQAEHYATRSARTVTVPAGAERKSIALLQSALHPGLYELPDGVEVPFGLPGLTGQRLETIAQERDGHRLSNATVAEGWFPDTEGLTFHPIAVFNTRGALQDRVKLERQDRKKMRGKRVSVLDDYADEPITIFGNDDRVNIYPSGYPERCICRIEVYTRDVANGPWMFRKRGTGFMAGDRVMLSSGHMAPPSPNAGWMIKVVPGSYDGQSVYGPAFLTYASDYVSWYSDAGNDLMACRLYDAIGQTTGYFGAISYSSAWEDQPYWSMCGYPFDRGETRPTFQGSIPVRDDDDGDDIRLPDGSSHDTTQIENEADRAKGASGSPLYSWFDNGQMYAVGVHHGLEIDWIFPAGQEKFSAASGGAGLPALINWARAAWPL